MALTCHIVFALSFVIEGLLTISFVQYTNICRPPLVHLQNFEEFEKSKISFSFLINPLLFISYPLADEFKDVAHSLDIWHKSKNIRK